MIDSVESAPVFSGRDVKQLDLFSAQQQTLNKYLPGLDGLRALAIISVVWHNVTAGHYTGGAVSKIINMFSNSGWVGVQLFFVLSGFLITGILLDEKKTQHQLRNFYMRRFLRIFPLYYAVLCIAFLILPILNAEPSWLVEERHQQVWYWTFLSNWSAPFFGSLSAFGHFWSLAVEEQFYLLWPLLVMTLQRRSLISVCLLLMISALLIREALVLYDLPFALNAAYKFTVARWDALAVGAFLALAVRQHDWYARAVKWMPHISWSSFAYILVFMSLSRNFAPVGPGITVLNQTVAALLFAAMLFFAIQPEVNRPTHWQKVLTSAPLRSVGKYSYAIYVFHLPMVQIMNGFWKDFFSQKPPLVGVTGFSILIFVASYAAAYCSWYLLERPCLSMKRFFSSNSK